ncbi:MAG: IS200/IS605 family element transposase accessory protein TnpB [Methanosarcinales archaeon]|uniref:IS200/IS605 family element transposase accessory protein TnpB n=1 Tax=Candidatus Ethanoperedens thermophilum TaxID=2766897 RepID=A0A848DBE2_9EURY|nr:IS200/IS605 family element transposase accessory protein TnpB [Candidatus Ethanoperedens thermophilum]
MVNIGETLKTILINCLPLTSKKQQIRNSFFKEYLRVLNATLKSLPDAKSSNDLHHLTYFNIRETSFLPSDIVQEARKDVWAKRKTVNNRFKRCSIRLNKRWFRFFTTDRATPSFKITYAPHKTFTIPIAIDGGYDRFTCFLDDGWVIKTISLLDSKIAVAIDKDFEVPANISRYVVGVDVGSTTLAAITIFDTLENRVVKQLYFGRDVAIRQRRIADQRALLRSNVDKGSDQAKKSLKRLANKQFNFVKTRSGQIAKEIVELAVKHSASIAIEKLTIRSRKHQFNKTANRKINTIPYAQLRDFLISNCAEYGVYLDQVDPYHTSKWCPHCGAVNNGHATSNYALYRCKECGLVVNSDRNASLVVAIKSALVRENSQGLTNLFSQFTRAKVPVNGLFRPDDKFLSCAVHDISPLMESPFR